MTSRIPFSKDLLSLHTAVVGKTRSGKTNSAKVIVEDLVAAGERVAIIDPIKSDWYGLTMSSDGRKAGLPFKILGGPFGHIPLHGDAGAAVGKLVASGALPLSIIDMADLGPRDFGKFYLAFVEAIFRNMTGVLHVVIEEAHNFAPKERVGGFEENMQLHWTKKLAEAGGSKGIRLIVCTQTVQKLHNEVLGSCDPLIAHRMVLPAQIKPVRDWITAAASKEAADEVARSLPQLKTGEAWVYSGEHQVRDRVQFPKCHTYDNSRTPTSGGKDAPKLTPPAVDLAELRSLLGKAVEEVEANDPKKLRAEIAELQKKLKEKSDAKIDNAELDNAREAMMRLERLLELERRTFRDCLGVMRTKVEQVVIAIKELDDVAHAHEEDIERRERNTPKPLADGSRLPEQSYRDPTVPAANGSTATVRAGLRGHTPRAAEQPAPGGGNRASADGDKLSGPELSILNALSFWSQCGDDSPARAAVAVVANYSASSSSFVKAAGSLRMRELISYPTADSFALTAKGAAAAPESHARLSLHDFQDKLLGLLPGPEAAVLRAAIKTYPRAITREACAAGAGYSVNSSSFVKAAGSLRSRGFLDYPDAQSFIALDVVFPKSLR